MSGTQRQSREVMSTVWHTKTEQGDHVYCLAHIDRAGRSCLLSNTQRQSREVMSTV